jgi:hypothetical protein
MPHDVFISHSSKDKVIADAVCSTLEAAGIRCWIAPRDILPGANWGESIIDALSTSKAMVLIFSANSNESGHVVRELERAVNRNIPVIPFRIENVSLSKAMEYFISTAHWLDAYPLYEKHLEVLSQRLEGLIQSEPGGARAERPPPSAAPRPAVRQSTGIGKPLLIGGGTTAALLLAGLAMFALGNRLPGVAADGPVVYSDARTFYATAIRQRGLDSSPQQYDSLMLPTGFVGKRLKLLDFSSFEGADVDGDFWCAVEACGLEEFGPFLKRAAMVAPRESTRMAHSGLKSMNFAPESLCTTESNCAISKNRHKSVFQVGGATRVWICFWMWSNTNPRVASVHNCDTSLNLYYRLDRKQWTHLASLCGANPADPEFDAHRMSPMRLNVLLNGSSEFEIGFSFEGQRIEQAIAEPAFLIDDMSIIAEW